MEKHTKIRAPAVLPNPVFQKKVGSRPERANRFLVFFLFVLASLTMLWQQGLLSTAFLLGTSAAQQQQASGINSYWTAWHGRGGGWGNPWQWPGPENGTGGYWFEQSRDVLATMQSTYWNGTYWVETNCMQSFLNSLLMLQ